MFYSKCWFPNKQRYFNTLFSLGLKTPSLGHALACAGVHGCTLKHALVIHSRDRQTRFLDVKNRQVSLSNGSLWEVVDEKHGILFGITVRFIVSFKN